MTVVPLTEHWFDEFVDLLRALADYERPEPPDAAAIERLRHDAFGTGTPKGCPTRLAAAPAAAFALNSKGKAVGYATWFHMYSTFFAKPTMYWKTCSSTIRGNRARGQRSSSTCAPWAPSAIAGAWSGRCSTGIRWPASSITVARRRGCTLAGVSVHILGAKGAIALRGRCESIDRRGRCEVRCAICLGGTFCTDGGSSFEPTSVRRLHRLASDCLHRLAELSIGWAV